jgi:hypothetical protein
MVRAERVSPPNRTARTRHESGTLVRDGSLTAGQRTYRVDQIVSARISEQSFDPDPQFDLAASWAELVTAFRERLRVLDVTVTLDRRTRDQLRSEADPAIIEALEHSLGNEPDGQSNRWIG